MFFFLLDDDKPLFETYKNLVVVNMDFQVSIWPFYRPSSKERGDLLIWDGG